MTPEPKPCAQTAAAGDSAVSPVVVPTVALTSILEQSGSGGVHRLPLASQAELRTAASGRALLFGEVDLGTSRSAAEALAAIGRTLDFPDWYGANFDALADCLDDYGDEPASGGVVLLRGSEALRASDPATLETLIAVLAEVSAKRRDSAAPLWIFLAEAPASGAPKTQP
ncbi:barstar family protein [Rhodocyclus tenuis]|uniref:RNAse (Barnase) inhibitor barstar n=1 Tax=Rhodocyclus tenuis TaxID=1066 RepID=A0A840G4W3_RHOTE|nr:barstar family protein [Rhodocyclus tenuis]MBB4247423.1 RNAse (barnase) inhibitor barstar [Rhodocyclus tenuis]